MNETEIIVVSFDGYSDLWPLFFQCKERFWSDCEYKISLISNYKEFSSDSCRMILTGSETNWCDRLLKSLEQVDSENIILLLDDYLIGKKVDNDLIKELVSSFERDNRKYLRLINIPFKKSKCVVRKGIYEIKKHDEYGINLQPAIWKVDYLKSILEKVNGSRSAWEFEAYLLAQCTNEDKPLDGCHYTYENILNIHNGILQGKWFRKEFVYFTKLGMNIDISKRGVLPTAKYASYKLKRVIREHIPPTVRKFLKRILKKIGVKFVTEV